MSLRITACYLFVLFFSFFAYKRWFVSLCVAILLMSVLEHPDMPKSIAGIQGLNPWNFLFANVILAWHHDRARNPRAFDFPGGVKFAWMLFGAVAIIAGIRLLFDPGVAAKDTSFGAMFSDYFVNPIKWMLPGILLFDGCRSRENARMATFCILLFYLLLAIQVIRWMPFASALSGSGLSARASKITQNEIGFNRVTLSMMLGGASWAVLSTLILARTWKWRLIISFSAAVIMVGQALTGGRTGYAAWFVVGLILAVFRWRKFLILMPIAAFTIFAFLPGVRERLLQGIGGQKGNIIYRSDDYLITSGRTFIWPFVIKEIEQAPIIGHGRLGMITTGLSDMLLGGYEEDFGHPHNAYLEVLMDSGIVGLIPVLIFLALIIRHAFSLFLDRTDPLCSAVGGMCCAIVFALLIGSLAGQTFYPREGSVAMWATVGLMFRMYSQRTYSRMTGDPLFPDDPLPEAEVVSDERYPEEVVV